MDRLLLIVLAGLALAIAFTALALIGSHFLSAVRHAARQEEEQQQQLIDRPDETDPPTQAPDAGDEGRAEARVFVLARSVASDLPRPEDYPRDPAFAEGVKLLEQIPELDELVGLATGWNAVVSKMALDVLARKPSTPALFQRLLEELPAAPYFQQQFLLAALEQHQPSDVSATGAILTQIAAFRDDEWMEFQLDAKVGLRDSLQRWEESAGAPQLPTDLSRFPTETPKHLRALLVSLDLGGRYVSLMEQVDAWENQTVDTAFLASIGTVRTQQSEFRLEPFVTHPQLLQTTESLQTILRAERRRSALLVGESGAGKSVAAEHLFADLVKQGWVLFEAGATDLVAGQKYVGELEQRVQQVVQAVATQRKVVWYIPEFEQLFWAGQHSKSSTGLLDYLLPFIERDEIVVLGELHQAAYERLLQQRPRVQHALQSVRVDAMREDESLQLIRDWLAVETPDTPRPQLDESTLKEAQALAQQFLSEQALPGRLFEFIDLTHQRLIRPGDSSQSVALSVDDLIVTLASLTGLPQSILDERQGLDLDGLRQHFEGSVKGQADAIDCLVERVAMIKAGLTDPSRPAGVFLFAGPTGTGKTELAKTLAEYLFGSEDRMIRLDMSEFQSELSLSRLIGEAEFGAGTHSRSLVDSIRRQPFSVVLLDEFEKAHPNVWDLFLQVFDDGRLTDRQGKRADFRHSIVILTSNLGGTIRKAQRLGFHTDPGEFQPKAVQRAVEQAFRKEFINRLDRIVVFRALSLETMREVLSKELGRLGKRRGLRSRDWALEFDESAIDLLLEAGFTPDMGARPLKRSIERLLLAPLAETIVRNQYPQGDQFLFVRGDGEQLDVRFIDPETEKDSAATSVADEPHQPGSLAAIALGHVRTDGVIETLRQSLDTLANRVGEPGWSETKRHALQRINEDRFWERSDRYRILAEFEIRDRIEASFDRARSLFERLTRHDSARTPSEPLARLAQSLWLLEMATQEALTGRYAEVFVSIDVDSLVTRLRHNQIEFADQIFSMYRNWGKARGMKLKVLDSRGARGDSYRKRFTVSGYGAATLLPLETGIHLLEHLDSREAKSYAKLPVRVRTAVQSVDQLTDDNAVSALEAQAELLLSQVNNESDEPVRSYRLEPSPLVRDHRGNWRSGRLEAILAGDFDLMGAAQPKTVD